MLFKNEKYQIILMYFLFMAGGLWHILGWFTTTMRILASPLLIALGLIILVKITMQNKRLFWWSVLVIILSFSLEWLGVVTGVLFGHYTYGHVLQPRLFTVPIAIGFAWLAVTVSSWAVLRLLFPRIPQWGLIITTPLLMVVFDFLMEPAAMALDYWHWQNGQVPLQNYIAWYSIGLIWAVTGMWAGLDKIKVRAFYYHAWMAQAIYFLMVYLIPG